MKRLNPFEFRAVIQFAGIKKRFKFKHLALGLTMLGASSETSAGCGSGLNDLTVCHVTGFVDSAWFLLVGFI
jgi:hypothetical protein